MYVDVGSFATGDSVMPEDLRWLQNWGASSER